MVQDADLARGYIGAATDTSAPAAHSAGGGRGTLVYQSGTTPVDGTSGTYAGIAPAGALLVAPNGDDEWTLYQNTGTQASPTWAEKTASGGGSGPAYEHTVSGVETSLAIPRPATGTHARVFLYVPASDPVLDVYLPDYDTGALVASGYASPIPTRVTLECPFFREASPQACVVQHLGASNNPIVLPTGGDDLLVLAGVNDNDQTPMAFPVGTKVEAWVD